MTSNPVRIATGNITFDQATDDGRGHACTPATARRRPTRQERVTIVNARCVLDRDGNSGSRSRAHRRQRPSWMEAMRRPSGHRIRGRRRDA
jgi:hypothetical protein